MTFLQHAVSWTFWKHGSNTVSVTKTRVQYFDAMGVVLLCVEFSTRMAWVVFWVRAPLSENSFSQC